MKYSYGDHILGAPEYATISQVKYAVRIQPARAQDVLEREYRRFDGPRWTLVQWLKRHRLHNPTVRVIPNR